MFEKVIGDGLEHWGLLGAKSLCNEFLVHGFDHEVQPERLSVPPLGHACREPRVGGARGGHAGVAKEFIPKRVGEAGIIPNETIKRELIEAGELLAFGEFVQVHLEGALGRAQ